MTAHSWNANEFHFRQIHFQWFHYICQRRREVFHNIWKIDSFFICEENLSKGLKCPASSTADTRFILPFISLQTITENMAGKFFKSFFPSVKAQEEAELVNPQEVLRVCTRLQQMNESNHSNDISFMVFRRNAKRVDTLKVCLPNTKRVTTGSTRKNKQPRLVLKNSSIIFMSWITVLLTLCSRS